MLILNKQLKKYKYNLHLLIFLFTIYTIPRMSNIDSVNVRNTKLVTQM